MAQWWSYIAQKWPKSQNDTHAGQCICIHKQVNLDVPKTVITVIIVIQFQSTSCHSYPFRHILGMLENSSWAAWCTVSTRNRIAFRNSSSRPLKISRSASGSNSWRYAQMLSSGLFMASGKYTRQVRSIRSQTKRYEVTNIKLHTLYTAYLLVALHSLYFESLQFFKRWLEEEQ